tara:strand:+ start:568 stop:918 length:351 start_codon:yes stop_codon:yes gene_type:complete
MKTTFTKYSEAKLKNNCPECYSTDGLTLSFAQKHEENKFFDRSSNEVQSTMKCSKCGTTIYPARWTEDIERVYEYNRKLAVPPKPYFKFKALTAILLIAVVLAGAVAAYLIFIMNK